MPAWLPRLSALAGLALSSASCEVLIGIPDVTRDTGSGGSTCSAEPCVGDACAPVEIASIQKLLGTGGDAASAVVSGLTARDGVIHWGIDGMPADYIVRTEADGTSLRVPVVTVPRRMADDGATVFWTAVYGTCLGLWPTGGKPGQMGVCGTTQSDRSPGVALEGSRAYWTIPPIDDCGAIPGCCGPGGKSCVVGAEKGAAAPVVLVGARTNVTDVVIAGSELFFAGQISANTGTLEHCPADAKACSPEVLVQGSGSDVPIALAAGGGYVYWSSSSGLVRRKNVAAKDSPPEDVADNAYVLYMTGDERAIYYSTTEGKVFQLAHDAPGAPVQVGSGKASFLGLDCASVYWGDGASIFRRPR